MLKPFLQKLLQNQTLERTACRDAMLSLLLEDVPAEQIAAFLTLLHARGETVEEILGAIDALQSQMLAVPVQDRVLDIVGTGGDYSSSLNISTASAIVAAASGVKIAKHGNRAVSSQCGSADVLEALGIDIAMPASEIAAGITEFNIGFCFAQKFHPVLAKLRDIRRRLGIPTIFNLVGPFLNPARPAHYMIGVFSNELLTKFAEILSAMTVEKSVVVHSMGMDEMSCCGLTKTIRIENGRQYHEEVDPQALGLSIISRESLRGGSPAHNAAVIQQTLAGENNSLRETLILNAAMSLFLYGICSSLAEAVDYAASVLQHGEAKKTLEKWQKYSQARSVNHA